MQKPALNENGLALISRLANAKPKGFTLIELVLVIALLGIILALTTVNLFRPVSKAKVGSISSDIFSLLREAQNKAMNTDTSGSGSSGDYGVHFETGKYVLFKGTSFDPSDPLNLLVTLPQNTVITPTLPCASPPGDCNNIIFQRISGEVLGFDNASNRVCVTETATNTSVSLVVNLLGVVNVQEGC